MRSKNKKETKTIWSTNLEECERIWKNDYMDNGWDVYEPLEVKWNWTKFNYMYTFTVIKL